MRVTCNDVCFNIVSNLKLLILDASDEEEPIGDFSFLCAHQGNASNVERNLNLLNSINFERDVVNFNTK